MLWSGYYGLAYDPFDKQNLREKDFFPTRDYNEMIGRLNYLKDVRGIGVFTASSGMGKSYTLRCFAKSLNPNLFSLYYICMTTVSVKGFYKELSAKLGLPTSGSKEMLFEKIKEQLAATFTQSGRTPIFVIDEAQFLRQAVLDDLRMLTNFEIDSKNYFVLILSGEPRLVSTLLTPVNEALRQRIVVHYSFDGLSDEEAGKLIVHKIQSAGGAASIIDPAATNAVIAAAHGNSRKLDRIMSQAILIGAQNKKTTIDTDTIEASVMQLKLQGGLNDVYQ